MRNPALTRVAIREHASTLDYFTGQLVHLPTDAAVVATIHSIMGTLMWISARRSANEYMIENIVESVEFALIGI